MRNIATAVNLLDGSVAQDLNPSCATGTLTMTDLYGYTVEGRTAERRLYSNYFPAPGSTYFTWTYGYDTSASSPTYGQPLSLLYPRYRAADGSLTGSGRTLWTGYYAAAPGNPTYLRSLGTCRLACYFTRGLAHTFTRSEGPQTGRNARN